MVIAALVSFAILLIAWLVAPSGAPTRRQPEVEIDAVALAEAA